MFSSLIILMLWSTRASRAFQPLAGCAPATDRAGRAVWQAAALPYSCQSPPLEAGPSGAAPGTGLRSWCDEPGVEYPWKGIRKALERSGETLRVRLHSIVESNVRLLRLAHSRSAEAQAWRRSRSLSHEEYGDSGAAVTNTSRAEQFKAAKSTRPTSKSANDHHDDMIDSDARVEGSGGEEQLADGIVTLSQYDTNQSPDSITNSVMIENLDDLESKLESAAENTSCETPGCSIRLESKSKKGTSTLAHMLETQLASSDAKHKDLVTEIQNKTGQSNLKNSSLSVNYKQSMPTGAEEIFSNFDANTHQTDDYIEERSQITERRDDKNSNLVQSSDTSEILSDTKLSFKSPSVQEFKRKTTVFSMEMTTSRTTTQATPVLNSSPDFASTQTVSDAEVVYVENDATTSTAAGLTKLDAETSPPTTTTTEPSVQRLSEQAQIVAQVTEPTSRPPPTTKHTINNFYSKPACSSLIEVRSPFYALNTQNVWKTLINMPPFESFIYMEHCKEEGTQGHCAPNCRCKQRFTVRTIPVYETDARGCDTIYLDKFMFPSHCDCMCHIDPYAIFQQSAGETVPEQSTRDTVGPEVESATTTAATAPAEPEEPITATPVSNTTASSVTEVAAPNQHLEDEHTNATERTNRIEYSAGDRPTDSVASNASGPHEQSEVSPQQEVTTPTAAHLDTVPPRVPIEAELYLPLHTHRNRNRGPAFSPVPRYVTNELEPANNAERGGRSYFLASPR